MRPLVILSLMLGVTSAQAFEIDLNKSDVESAKGRYLLEELTVAAKGRVTPGYLCVLDRSLFISERAPLVTDGDFVISRKPTGNVSLVFEPLDYKDKPTTEIYDWKRPVWFLSCDLFTSQTGLDASTFTPVDDIDGFAKYSDWVEHVLKKFRLDD